MSEETAKKLAMEVRQSNKSEEFDLSGYGPNSVTKLVQDAFTAPLPLGNMVRLSFVVGGGKKVRQKYNDGLERLLCDALNGIGFTEDKGAALSLECAGQYKYQHDLGKDLKFVHVFPRVDTAAAAAAEAGDSASADAMSPSQLLLFSELPIFQRMVAAKTPSFAQRKRVLDVLKQAKSDYAALEAKLAALEALNEREQQLLDELDTDALDEKQKWLAKEMEAMVAAGQLSKEEKAMVLEQLHTKLEAVETQIALAESEGKEKRAAKLKEGHAELLARIETVTGLAPVHRRVKFEKEILAARKQLAELDKLEARSKKEVLPLSEIEKLNKRSKLTTDLQAMVEDSAGWFAS
eukprot:Transcript_25389.p1 GENE.Transcript_25389~~Transcript_25389.p1  ORF type:complete len:383 (+),score=190.05 Transcript_25389:101-1150(+)